MSSNWVGLIALDRWISSARLAEALQASGLRVAAFCKAHAPLTATRHVDQLTPVIEASLRPALERFSAAHRPAALVPCDERAVRALHALFADPSISIGLRALIERSLGDPRGYAIATSKWSTYEMACRLGLRVPAQALVDSLEAALAFAAVSGYPVILKREGTYGGIGCHVCRSERDLLSGYGALLAAGRLQRLRRRAESWVGWHRDRTQRSIEPLIIQRFHDGQLTFSAAAARNGIMLKGLSTTAERVHPEPTGASTVVRLRETPDLVEITELLIRELGYSGFIGVDFILEHRSGHAYLLEINPRLTPVTALGRRLGYDLCGAFAAGYAGAAPSPETRQATIAALFPNEWLRDPASPFLTTAYHDVPLQDPGLMAWIYRHLPAKRRLMLRSGMLQCAGIEWPGNGSDPWTGDELPTDPVDLDASKQRLKRRVG